MRARASRRTARRAPGGRALRRLPAARRGSPLSPRTRPRLVDGVVDVETPSGLARAHVSGAAGGAAGLVVLGHGAGGGIDAPDLVAVTVALVDAGWVVARVEQPYRVAGRRAPAAAPQLDAAWREVVAALRARSRGRLVVGGRSSGARVACRTATACAADAVVCLAFPLHPPARPDRSRAGELGAVEVPVLVVQGERDPFGAPAELPAGPTVIAVEGDHALRRSAEGAAAAVRDWLGRAETWRAPRNAQTVT